MKRDIYSQLLAWKTSDRRKPLLLRGARQVGKTHLLKEFGAAEFQRCVYVNFEEDPQIKNFFERDLNPRRILSELALYLNTEISLHTTLLIFDEIQECPNAVTSLKYFNEQANEYCIAAAGSLLGVKLAKNKGFPVGKINFLDLYPLTFLEFLTALGKSKLRDFLQQISIIEPLAEPIHLQLVELLRSYLFVGGMPEVVQEYVKTTALPQVRVVQKEILTAYLLDFAKHAPPNEIMKITTIWDAISGQLAKENKKFIFSAIRKGARGREYEIAIQWITDAGLISKSFNVTTPKLPLDSYADKNIFKIFLLDVGLLGAMSGLPPQVILQGDVLFSEFKGALTENFVAQELKAKYGHSTYYWTSAGSAEVDFLVSVNNQIIPLEVKAGVSSKQKSLKVYQEKYHTPYIARASLMNLNRDGVVNYPLYLMGLFPIDDKEMRGFLKCIETKIERDEDRSG